MHLKTKVKKEMQNLRKNVAANYILVYSEKYETMKFTLDFALEAKLEIANFDNAIFYPTYSLYLQEIQSKIKLSHNYSGFSHYSYDTKNLTSNHLSITEISDFRNYAWNKYHNDDGYLKLVENKFGSEPKKNLEETTAIKLKQNF